MPATASHPIVKSYLLRQRTWSDHHKRCAVSILNRWCRWLADRGVELRDATGDDCTEFLAWRESTVAGSTAHKDYQHLRWLYVWLVEEGELDTRRALGPMHNIKAPTVNDPDPDRTGYVTADEYEALMSVFDKRKTADCRDAAICSLMYWSGLRRSEVARCEVDRVDLEAGTLDVLGKNGKWRTIPIAMETLILIERYLRRRAGDPSPALFSSSKLDEGDGRLKPGAISLMLKRRCAKAGIKVTSHEFRRAMAIDAAERGVSDTSICTIAGWRDNRMLARYQRAASEKLAASDFAAHDPTAKRAAARRRAAYRGESQSARNRRLKAV